MIAEFKPPAATSTQKVLGSMQQVAHAPSVSAVTHSAIFHVCLLAGRHSCRFSGRFVCGRLIFGAGDEYNHKQSTKHNDLVRSHGLQFLGKQPTWRLYHASRMRKVKINTFGALVAGPEALGLVSPEASHLSACFVRAVLIGTFFNINPPRSQTRFRRSNSRSSRSLFFLREVEAVRGCDPQSRWAAHPLRRSGA